MTHKPEEMLQWKPRFRNEPGTPLPQTIIISGEPSNLYQLTPVFSKGTPQGA